MTIGYAEDYFVFPRRNISTQVTYLSFWPEVRVSLLTIHMETKAIERHSNVDLGTARQCSRTCRRYPQDQVHFGRRGLAGNVDDGPFSGDAVRVVERPTGSQLKRQDKARTFEVFSDALIYFFDRVVAAGTAVIVIACRFFSCALVPLCTRRPHGVNTAACVCLKQKEFRFAIPCSGVIVVVRAGMQFALYN